MQQLRKLRFCSAAVEAKAILAKVYAAAFYFIEAAEVPVAKIAIIIAAIIGVFRSRNDSRNVDCFFSAFLGRKKEIGPMAQIVVRRDMQVRRAIGKRKGTNDRFKAIVGKHSSRCKEQWPTWYRQGQAKEQMPLTGTRMCSHTHAIRHMGQIATTRSKRWGQLVFPLQQRSGMAWSSTTI